MPLINLTYSREGFDAARAKRVVEDIRESLVAHYAMPGARDAIRSFVRCRTNEVDAARCHVWTPPGWAPSDGKAHYEIDMTVSPHGLDDERAASVLSGATRRVHEAEGSEATEANLRRVWAAIREMTDGRWAMGGIVLDARKVVREALRRQRAFDAAAGIQRHRHPPTGRDEAREAAE